MASFQAKIGCYRLTNRENKKCRSVSFPPTRNRKFQKNSKKFKKIKKIPLWRDFKPKLVGKYSERENKNYCFVSFRLDAVDKIQEK